MRVFKERKDALIRSKQKTSEDKLCREFPAKLQEVMLRLAAAYAGSKFADASFTMLKAYYTKLKLEAESG